MYTSSGVITCLCLLCAVHDQGALDTEGLPLGVGGREQLFWHLAKLHDLNLNTRSLVWVLYAGNTTQNEYKNVVIKKLYLKF